MFFQAFEDHHLIPREHERHCSLRRLFIGTLPHQKPSQTRAAFSPRHSSASFSLCSCVMFSAELRRASPSTPEATATCLILRVLVKAGTTSMFSMLTERRLRWLDHVTRMQRRQKISRLASLPLALDRQRGPSSKDVCKWDLRAGGIALLGIEAVPADRSVWKLAVKSAVTRSEQGRRGK